MFKKNEITKLEETTNITESENFMHVIKFKKRLENLVILFIKNHFFEKFNIFYVKTFLKQISHLFKQKRKLILFYFI